MYEERIATKKSCYKGKLIEMDEGSWPKFICRESGNSQWQREDKRINRKWGLIELHGSDNWLNKIKAITLQKGQEKWERGIQNRVTLAKGFPIRGTCTPRGTFYLPQGYIRVRVQLLC